MNIETWERDFPTRPVRGFLFIASFSSFGIIMMLGAVMLQDDVFRSRLTTAYMQAAFIRPMLWVDIVWYNSPSFALVLLPSALTIPLGIKIRRAGVPSMTLSRMRTLALLQVLTVVFLALFATEVCREFFCAISTLGDGLVSKCQVVDGHVQTLAISALPVILLLLGLLGLWKRVPCYLRFHGWTLQIALIAATSGLSAMLFTLYAWFW